MLNAHAPILLNERYYQRLRDLLTQLAAITCQNGLQALLLFLVSVLLVVLFTRMIIGPVKAVERMINHFGAGRARPVAAQCSNGRASCVRWRSALSG